MKKIWKKFENYLKANFMEGYNALHTAAADADIKALEATIGSKIPDDFKQSLKIHNGQKNLSVGLLYSGGLLSVENILKEWNMWKQLLDAGELKSETISEPQGAIRNDWWNQLWLPIASDGSGNSTCIDLAPDRNGTLGQITDLDHEAADRIVLADSFKEWFSRYVDDVINGEYLFSKEYGSFIHKSDYTEEDDVDVSEEENRSETLNLQCDSKGALVLFETGVSDGDIKIISKQKSLCNLNLGACKNITDEALRYIGNSKNLKVLYLQDTNIDGTGFEYLASLQNLEKIVLSNTSLKQKNLLHLAALKSLSEMELNEVYFDLHVWSILCIFPVLTRVDFAFSENMTAQGIEKMAASKTIKQINLQFTRATQREIEKLTDIRKDIEIIL